jgi:hypothetical protein
VGCRNSIVGREVVVLYRVYSVYHHTSSVFTKVVNLIYNN